MDLQQSLNRWERARERARGQRGSSAQERRSSSSAREAATAIGATTSVKRSAFAQHSGKQRDSEKHNNTDQKPAAPGAGRDRRPTRGERREEPRRDESRAGGSGGTQTESDCGVSRAFKNCCARSRTANVVYLLREKLQLCLQWSRFCCSRHGRQLWHNFRL
ncbi:unnamed protein product [Sphagnum balticum]